jgi:hypothetical protein
MRTFALVLIAIACVARLAFSADTDAPGPDRMSQEQVTQNCSNWAIAKLRSSRPTMGTGKEGV